jgi:uncharacterized protein YjbJ (UPF0337 family)
MVKVGKPITKGSLFQRNWKELRGGIQEKWGRLTDDDLDVISGRRDQLVGKIQERYGVNKDQVKKEVDDWFTSVLNDK